MPEVNVLAVLACAVATFLLGGLVYAVLGDQLAASDLPVRPGWQLPLVELGRGLLLSAVVAGVAAYAGITTFAGGLLLGLVLWVGLPAVLFAGAVFHEGLPARRAAIHAGDWLLKLLVVGAVVAVWQ
jgi:hypothetical protein